MVPWKLKPAQSLANVQVPVWFECLRIFLFFTGVELRPYLTIGDTYLGIYLVFEHSSL